MRIRNIYIIIVSVIVLLLHLQSCKVSKRTSIDHAQSESTPRIIFLNCTMSYDSIQHEYKMSLINKIITFGTIKKHRNEYDTSLKGDFSYSVLNSKSEILLNLYMPCPLDKTFEFVDNMGKLAKKDFRLDSTEFSLRIPLDDNARYITCSMHKKRLILIDLLE